MPYELCCVILGRDHAFTVKVKKTHTVCELKKIIKTVNLQTLANVDVVVLMLYKINIDVSNTAVYNGIMLKISQHVHNFGNKEQLYPFHMILKYFQGNLGEKIEVLVEIPPGELIYCGGIVLMADGVDPQIQTQPNHPRPQRPVCWRSCCVIQMFLFGLSPLPHIHMLHC